MLKGGGGGGGAWRVGVVGEWDWDWEWNYLPHRERGGGIWHRHYLSGVWVDVDEGR